MSISISKIKINEYLPALISLIICLLGPTNCIITILLLLLFGFIYFRFSPYDKSLLYLLIISFILRLIVIAFDTHFHFLQYSWDVDNFNMTALKIKNNFINNVPIFHKTNVSLSVKSYSFFVSIFYYFLGEHQSIIRIINAFIGILTVAKIYQICLEIFDDIKTARLAAFLVSFFPAMIIFTSINMRDSLIFYLSMAIIFRFILFSKSKRRFLNFFFFALDLILLILLRNQYIFLFALIFIFYFLFIFLRKLQLSKIKFILFSTLLIVLFMFTFLNLEISNKFLSYSTREMEWRSSGGSAYLQSMRYDSWIDILRYIPVRFIHFTFGPFIWEIKNIFHLFAFLEAILIIMFFYYTLKTFSKYKNKYNFNLQILLLLFGFFGLISNAIIDSNYGTAIRHRMIYVPIFIIFACRYLRNYQIKI